MLVGRPLLLVRVISPLDLRYISPTEASAIIMRQPPAIMRWAMSTLVRVTVRVSVRVGVRVRLKVRVRVGVRVRVSLTLTLTPTLPLTPTLTLTKVDIAQRMMAGGWRMMMAEASVGEI